MTHLRELNNANTAKIMAETFGRYNIFATLSLSLSQVLTASHTLFEIADIRARIAHIRTYFVPEYVEQIAAKIQQFFTLKL